MVYNFIISVVNTLLIINKQLQFSFTDGGSSFDKLNSVSLLFNHDYVSGKRSLNVKSENHNHLLTSYYLAPSTTVISH